jgi:hypothetical protein
MSSDRIQLAFYSAATQYYVTGRYGVLAGQIPVAGNLLHHAIEMYLKGALAKTMTLKQLRGLSHGLPDLWATFKAKFPSARLARFDSLVSSLHAFEELRYPDPVLSKGTAVTAGMTRVAGAGPSVADPVPGYELYLEEIDALVGRIFQVASVNPAFFLARLTTRAREYLKEGNAQPWAG